jgi:glycosyltransferase involved in cell wall biosynthesis
MTHILFLTDNFPPESNAPASRTFEHCRHWVDKGVQVTVITCAPNFPNGKVFKGYKNKIWKEEFLEGIRVIRVKTFIAPNKGFFFRTIDFLSFMFASFIASLFIRKVSLIIGTSPQFFTAIAAFMSSRVKRIPWVFELRDLWPESIQTVGAMRSRWLLNILEKIELFLYGQAAAVICVTNAFKENLIARGIEKSNIHVITNGVDLAAFAPSRKNRALQKKLNLNEKFTVGYVGTIGLAHSLRTILETARLYKAEGNLSIHFLIVGDGSDKKNLKDIAEANFLTNVTFVDSVPRAVINEYWSLLDSAVIHLKKSPTFEGVIPSKIFECMAMGIPLLHGVEGESREIVERNRVGISFEPESSGGLKLAIDELVTNQEKRSYLAQNCLLAAPQFDRNRLAAEMLEILRKL